MNRKQKQTLILTGALFFIVAFSTWLARHLATNMENDVSQERASLTKEYKEIKDDEFIYAAKIAAQVYSNRCSYCHGDQGQGQGTNPPLTTTNYDDTRRVLSGIIYGRGSMPHHRKVSNQDLAHVITYIQQEFGKKTTVTTPLNIIDFRIDYLKDRTER